MRYFLVLVPVFIIGILSILTYEPAQYDHRSAIDRWAASQYTITCYESWETGYGIRTHSTYGQFPHCLLHEGNEAFPLEYTVNYQCNGEYNLTYTYKDESWGVIFPGCENENVSDNIQVQVR